MSCLEHLKQWCLRIGLYPWPGLAIHLGVRNSLMLLLTATTVVCAIAHGGLVPDRASNASSCTVCEASPWRSVARVVRAADGVQAVQITAFSDDGRRKLSGGDAWEVAFSGERTHWRVQAEDLGQGIYIASVGSPHIWGEALLQALPTLLWTTKSDIFLEQRWDQQSLDYNRGSNVTLRSFRTCTTSSLGDEICEGMQCVSQSMPPLNITLDKLTERQTTGAPCSSDEAAGVWIQSTMHRRHAGGRLHASATGEDQDVRWAWQWSAPMPCGSRGTCSRQEAVVCLANRRLLLLGDSTLFGDYLELCAVIGNHQGERVCKRVDRLAEHLGNGTGGAEYLRQQAGDARVVWADALLIPNHYGLELVVGTDWLIDAWSCFFSSLHGWVVVIGSAAHDVAPLTYLDGSKNPRASKTLRIAPLERYRLNSRRLAFVLERARRLSAAKQAAAEAHGGSVASWSCDAVSDGAVLTSSPTPANGLRGSRRATNPTKATNVTLVETPLGNATNTTSLLVQHRRLLTRIDERRSLLNSTNATNTTGAANVTYGVETMLAPPVHFIWRQSTYANLAAQGCAKGGYPTSYPVLVQRMNEIARIAMRNADVAVWDEPALLTASAPRAAFHDSIHVDVCHFVFEHLTGKERMANYAKCLQRREGGQRSADEPLLQNHSGFHEGVNLAIIHSLLKQLGCPCAGG